MIVTCGESVTSFQIDEPSPVLASSEVTIIELSRKKLIGLAIISGLFVAGGIRMVLGKNPYEYRVFWFFNNPTFVHAIGIASILFFGLCLLALIKKLVEKRPGLILNASGLLDNSAATSAGFVAWSDIAGFEAMDFWGQKLLVVKLENPARYLTTGNPLIRVLRRMNVGLIGSPIAISSNTLRVSFPELVSVCNLWLANYRGSTRPA